MSLAPAQSLPEPQVPWCGWLAAPEWQPALPLQGVSCPKAGLRMLLPIWVNKAHFQQCRPTRLPITAVIGASGRACSRGAAHGLVRFGAGEMRERAGAGPAIRCFHLARVQHPGLS